MSWCHPADPRNNTCDFFCFFASKAPNAQVYLDQYIHGLIENLPHLLSNGSDISYIGWYGSTDPVLYSTSFFSISINPICEIAIGRHKSEMLCWLIFINLVLIVSSMSSPGEFVNPSAEATQNPVWVTGTQQILSWETNLRNYTIALWNQNSDRSGYSKGPALLGKMIVSMLL